MKTGRLTSIFLLALIWTYGGLYAEEQVLWGRQIAGSGHMKNARTEGNTLVLTAPATILKVEGDQDDYCIWAKVTPENRQARSVLCGGKDRESLVGKTLPAGSYTVIPSVEEKSKAEVRITFK